MNLIHRTKHHLLYVGEFGRSAIEYKYKKRRDYYIIWCYRNKANVHLGRTVAAAAVATAPADDDVDEDRYGAVI